MTCNNETVSRQMPWAGNIAKTMTSNRKQCTVIREMLTTVARHLSIKWLFVFHRFDQFVLLYNKSLNDWSFGEQWILFPLNLNVSRDEVEGNIIYICDLLYVFYPLLTSMFVLLAYTLFIEVGKHQPFDCLYSNLRHQIKYVCLCMHLEFRYCLEAFRAPIALKTCSE